MPQTVLVTGSAGTIGRAVCKALLAAGHTVRGFDLIPTPDVPDAIVGNIADPALWQQAMPGVTAIVHLAAAMEWLEFLRDQVPANVIAIYHLFETAKQHHVPRIVLASSVMVGGKHRKDRTHLRTAEEITWPHNTYGATKVFAEEMGKVYSRQSQTSVIASRICWLPRNADSAREIQAKKAFGGYTSHDDAGRFFLRAVESQHPDLGPGTFHAMYLTSRAPDPAHRWVDISPARDLLGYEPQDVFPVGIPAEWGIRAEL
jgi:uronate dehydrogenase